MVYDSFADYSKKTIHNTIEFAFPRTASIAGISAFTGWYAYRYTLTYAPSFIANLTTQQFQNILPCVFTTCIEKEHSYFNIGHIVSPLFVPEATAYTAEKFGFAVSLFTSITLNMIAQLFFGIKSRNDETILLPEFLNKQINPEQPTTVKTQPVIVETKQEKLPLKTIQSNDEQSIPTLHNTSDTALESKAAKNSKEKIQQEQDPTISKTEGSNSESEKSKLYNKNNFEIHNSQFPLSTKDELNYKEIFGEDPINKTSCFWNVCPEI